ncbi:cathepsin L-like proteinase [Coccinella septempunctata]|uniref:cathepsin L-like proteinase n=1 Tax=Coccinella septempunctata TaxID=41139 RepID=UPI001D0868FB|nr:cathepsin L-like proteinase [Coccinella septempunctata]
MEIKGAVMIQLSLVCAFSAVCLVTCFDQDKSINVKDKWEQFLRVHNKNYDYSEKNRRYKIFQNNLRTIDQHNWRYRKGIESFEMGIGPFADQTEREFKLMFEKQSAPSKTTLENNGICKLSVNRTKYPPYYVDYRSIMQPIKDQKPHLCGAGWAFAAVATVEGMTMKKLKWDKSLSEQSLLDCAVGHGYQSYGCNGGSLWGAMFYMKTYGAETSEDYPYEAAEKCCRSRSKPLVRVETIFNCQGTEQELMRTVASHGPVATMIEVTPYIMHYKKGIVFDRNCVNGANHAVTIVGYGMENGFQYWLLKNSWGRMWGERGYYKLARNYANICQIGKTAFCVDINC